MSTGSGEHAVEVEKAITGSTRRRKSGRGGTMPPAQPMKTTRWINATGSTGWNDEVDQRHRLDGVEENRRGFTG
jgi:hypothetical protein